MICGGAFHIYHWKLLSAAFRATNKHAVDVEEEVGKVK